MGQRSAPGGKGHDDTKIHRLPVDITQWKFDMARPRSSSTGEYDDGSADLLNLYEKGKQQQWDTSTRIDWSQELLRTIRWAWPTTDPDLRLAVWGKDDRQGKDWLRFNLQCHSICQFMHGEQGALIATAKIVSTVPGHERQVLCRHPGDGRGAPRRGLQAADPREVQGAYPITRSLQNLLEQTLGDRRWDMTYLGMQVLIEGLALAAFQRIRDSAKNNLAASINAYVMQDEGAPRHRSAAWRCAVLSAAVRRRARGAREFAVEALYFMRDRFNQAEVWERSGPAGRRAYRVRLQIGRHAGLPHAPVHPHRADPQGDRPVRPKVQKALGDMGVMEYAVDVAGGVVSRR